ncbi:unnamed protein product [Caenorhabditis bovis]|uniref:Uncharacterized protein n=1 Tax=Caenorhabditis bovis TaxID=2654633 RepID=A0A8S1ETX1_9PELO|nr:unnamed protein product [Caenorhabditis bovis]
MKTRTLADATQATKAVDTTRNSRIAHTIRLISDAQMPAAKKARCLRNSRNAEKKLKTVEIEKSDDYERSIPRESISPVSVDSSISKISIKKEESEDADLKEEQTVREMFKNSRKYAERKPRTCQRRKSPVSLEQRREESSRNSRNYTERNRLEIAFCRERLEIERKELERLCYEANEYYGTNIEDQIKQKGRTNFASAKSRLLQRLTRSELKRECYVIHCAAVNMEKKVIALRQCKEDLKNIIWKTCLEKYKRLFETCPIGKLDAKCQLVWKGIRDYFNVEHVKREAVLEGLQDLFSEDMDISSNPALSAQEAIFKYLMEQHNSNAKRKDNMTRYSAAGVIKCLETTISSPTKTDSPVEPTSSVIEHDVPEPALEITISSEESQPAEPSPPPAVSCPVAAQPPPPTSTAAAPPARTPFFGRSANGLVRIFYKRPLPNNIRPENLASASPPPSPRTNNGLLPVKRYIVRKVITRNGEITASTNPTRLIKLDKGMPEWAQRALTNGCQKTSKSCVTNITQKTDPRLLPVGLVLKNRMKEQQQMRQRMENRLKL